jgi:hypothetical protein
MVSLHAEENEWYKRKLVRLPKMGRQQQVQITMLVSCLDVFRAAGLEVIPCG